MKSVIDAAEEAARRRVRLLEGVLGAQQEVDQDRHQRSRQEVRREHGEHYRQRHGGEEILPAGPVRKMTETRNDADGQGGNQGRRGNF